MSVHKSSFLSEGLIELSVTPNSGFEFHVLSMSTESKSEHKARPRRAKILCFASAAARDGTQARCCRAPGAPSRARAGAERAA